MLRQSSCAHLKRSSRVARGDTAKLRISSSAESGAITHKTVSLPQARAKISSRRENMLSNQPNAHVYRAVAAQRTLRRKQRRKARRPVYIAACGSPRANKAATTLAMSISPSSFIPAAKPPISARLYHRSRAFLYYNALARRRTVSNIIK